jgi:hypothetical protein
VGENIRKIFRWLSSVHAPLGHWAPLAGAGLLTSTRLFHSAFLRALAYSGSAIVAILIASDIARSFIDPHAFPDRKMNPAPVSFPMQAMRVVLSVGLGSLYSFSDFYRYRAMDAAHLFATDFPGVLLYRVAECEPMV